MKIIKTSIAFCCFFKKSVADSEALLLTPTTGNDLKEIFIYLRNIQVIKIKNNNYIGFLLLFD